MIALSQVDDHWAQQLLDWVLPRAESDTLETKRVSGKMVGKALELLGKHYGLFEKDNKQKGEGLADAISALVASAQGAPLMPNAMSDDED